jgi:hypothetical protein
MDRFISQVNAKLQTIDREGAFHKDTVISLVTLIRQHLEANQLRSQYKVTVFYCDWCLHAMLDRSPVLVEFFQQIDDAIVDGKEALLNDRINDIISLKQLRNEILQILAPTGTASYLFSSYAGWKAFIRVFLNLLIEKPIIRNRQTNGKRFAGRFMLEVPELSNVDQAYLEEFAIHPDTVFWKILVLPIGYFLTGPLANTEHSENFSHE